MSTTPIAGVTSAGVAGMRGGDVVAVRRAMGLGAAALPAASSMAGVSSFSSTGGDTGSGWRWLATVSFPAGCPEDHKSAPAAEAEADADGDGVRVPEDRCPSEAEDKDDFQDADGCPEDDDDKDGILDSKDRCRGDAEDRDGFEDEDGCPEDDDDKDGIIEPRDRCPAKAEDLDHWQDEDGCPEDDNDQDGLVDAQDKCPNEPESKNGKDDEDGCPDLVRVEEGQIRTLEPVYFDYNKASIQTRSENMLGEMATLIKSRPDLGTISIQGHTDLKGSATYNLKLSRDRAAAVRAYLVRAGVAEERLTSDGFGSTKPIDDNKSELGRAKNRRVEFHFSL